MGLVFFVSLVKLSTGVFRRVVLAQLVFLVDDSICFVGVGTSVGLIALLDRIRGARALLFGVQFEELRLLSGLLDFLSGNCSRLETD